MAMEPAGAIPGRLVDSDAAERFTTGPWRRRVDDLCKLAYVGASPGEGMEERHRLAGGKPTHPGLGQTSNREALKSP